MDSKVFGVILAAGLVASAVATFIGWDQSTARHMGGSMTMEIPPGAQLVSMAWKGETLWNLYYLPADGRCVFKEVSPLGVLDGSVVVPNCNPVGLK